MSNRRTILDFPRNEAGLVDEFIGTAYDKVAYVADNLEAVQQAQIDMESVLNAVDRAETAADRSEAEADRAKLIVDSFSTTGAQADLNALKRDFFSALRFPFNGTVAGDTAAMNALMASSEKMIYFPGRVYFSGFQNEMSDRTFLFAEGAIIDGTAHVAIGKGPGLGTGSVIQRCKNVRVIGTLTATVRVGMIYAERFYADRLAITEVSPNYPNQSQNGGTSGVHIYYGCRKFNIGEIDVRSGTKDNYGLGIDTASVQDSEHRPTDIHIGTYRCSVSGAQSALATSETVGVTIDEVIVESVGGIGTSIGSLRDENMRIGRLTMDCSNQPGAFDGIYIQQSKGHTLGEVVIRNAKQIGFRVGAGATGKISVGSLVATGCTLEGARLESKVDFGSVDTSNNVGMGMHVQAAGASSTFGSLTCKNNGSTQVAITAPDVEVGRMTVMGPAGNTQFGFVLNAGASRFRCGHVEAFGCSQGVRILNAGPTWIDTMNVHDNAIGVATTGADNQGLTFGAVEFSNNTQDYNNILPVGFREQEEGSDIRGNVDITLTLKDHLCQIFNVPLTAARTITLPTTNLRLGRKFRVTRLAAASGAFALNVGAVKALSAAGQWCEVEYSTAGWILTAYGTL